MHNWFIKARIMCISILIFHVPIVSSAAEELDIVNRPVNVSGLTGLLFTSSPYTLPKGTFEIAASLLYENSVRPDFSITEFPLTISAGITDHAELALRGSYFQVRDEPSSGVGTERRPGEVELSYKWNFLPQPEDSNRPGLALIMTAIAATDSSHKSNKKSGVQNWGMKAGLAGGSEITVKEYVFCIYADIQAQAQDLEDQQRSDLYGIMNAGMLFPISKYRNLQMLVEYSHVFENSSGGGNYGALTYGIRLVSERFNATLGSQFLYKQQEGYDNSSRILALIV
ncbi:MAG: hypothetical protein WC539_00785 [Nitrospirota bacterium]